MKKKDMKFYEPYELYIGQLEEILNLVKRIVFLDFIKKSRKENDPYAKQLLKEQFFGSKLLLNIKKQLLRRQALTKINDLYHNCLSVYGIAPIHRGKPFYNSLAKSVHSSRNLHILESFIAECKREKEIIPPSILLNRLH